MTTPKRHRDGKVSRSGEIKHGRLETSLATEAEEELANHITILKDMSKLFHRTTNNEVKILTFEVA